MNYSHFIRKRAVVICATAAVIVVAAALMESGRGREVWRQAFSYLQQLPATVLDSGRSRVQAADGNVQPPAVQNPQPSATGNATLELPASQLSSIKLETVGTYAFPVERETVGTISFAEEQSVQVFPAYQGTIIQAFVELGAQVEKDQPLYTIKSPDLIQAESTLIGAAATFELTNKELERVKGLPGIAQRELEQATSDQQTADGALKAARDAVRVFGKTDAEIDQIIASRKIDPALVVHSPISGQIIAYKHRPA